MAQHAPADVYQGMIAPLFAQMASTPETLLAAEARPLVRALVLNGLILAPIAVDSIGTLKELWPQSSHSQRTALAEECTLSVLVYALSTQEELSVAAVEKWSEVLDNLFDHSFPEAAGFAASLFKQKLSDDEANARKAGVSLWAISMALQGAVAALGLKGSHMKPASDRFPVSNSQALRKAGVVLSYWDEQIGDTVVYHSLLVDRAMNALNQYAAAREDTRP